jgi:Family of unknown function (DUF6064)
MLPFTPEQFLAVFVDYNNAIWPIQIVVYPLGGVAVALLFRKTREADRAIALKLSMLFREFSLPPGRRQSPLMALL